MTRYKWILRLQQKKNRDAFILNPRGGEATLVRRSSTCVAAGLLPPGGHVALVTAAAGADLGAVLQRARRGVLAGPAAQRRRRRHRALQLGGGGEGVGQAAGAHRLDVV